MLRNKTIQRLLGVGGIVGFGRLAAFLSALAVVRWADPANTAAIASFQNASIFLIGVLSFGLHLHTNRKVVLAADTDQIIQDAQVARLTLSLLLLPLGLSVYAAGGHGIAWAFILLPFVAVNSDYVLYGLDRPIWGASLSALKVIMPSAALGVFAYYQSEQVFASYVVVSVVSILVATIVSTRLTHVSPISTPNIKSVMQYWSSAPIGIATLCLSGIRALPILLAEVLGGELIVILLYGPIQLYMLFVGLRAMIVQ